MYDPTDNANPNEGPLTPDVLGLYDVSVAAVASTQTDSGIGIDD